jgi:superfamily II DNA/RNA helicase
VATDVAARGIHVDEVELVVHVDPPAEHKAYLHRSGRTARAGESGDVVTVMLPAQRADVTSLLRKAAIEVTPQRVTASSPAVAKLVGDVAAYVKPAPQQPRESHGGGRSTGANAQRKQALRGGGSGGQRHDRSGRPAASSGGGRSGQSGDAARSGQAARTGGNQRGQARTGAVEHTATASSGRRRDAGPARRGQSAGASRPQTSGFTSYSTSTPASSGSSGGGERRSGRRAQG